MHKLYAALLFFFVATPVLAATVLFPSGGGTGTGTAPTYGQVLVGNSSGTYTPSATSSLKISTTDIIEGTKLFFTNQRALDALAGLYEVPLTFSWPLSRSTNTISFSGLSTSSPWTAGLGVYVVNGNTLASAATTTAGTGLTYSGNAFNVNTTQNIAKLSNLTGNGIVRTSGGDGTLSIGVNGTDYTLITAKTCNVGDFVSQVTAAGVFTCTTPASGSLYPFGLAGNATSTLTQFNGGLTAYASTTIGNGTVSGGLTVSGTATTTSLIIPSLTSALGLFDANHKIGAYAGASCTNQFPRSQSATGAWTCASVANTDLTNSSLTVNGTSIALGASGTITAASSTLLGNSNTFSGVNNFSANFGISSSTPGFKLAVNTVGSEFYVDSTGKIVGRDATNSFTGRLSPTRSFVLGSGTTTTWTASTTASAYSPSLVMPFTGTLQQVRCQSMVGASAGSFLGVNVKVNGSNATPSYFIASSTIGVMKFTAGNTFTAGQAVLVNFGTSTTATATNINCTFDATETP